MKPYIEFVLNFSRYYRSVSEDKIYMVLLSGCPFDHLPNELIRTDRNKFRLRIFFRETQSLEIAYRQLEGKMEELRDQLDLIFHCYGKVEDAHAGVLNTTDAITWIEG
ncbi:hypothetical protein [Candidatus Hodarchaeum mangrovi]